jgi:hypothetical protein
VIENDIKNDVQTFAVGGRHQIDQVLAGPESRIHVQKILNAIPVIGVQVPPLLEDGAQP